MDSRMKEKMRTGQLTDNDVRRIIDWQLTLSAERIDSQLIRECLLFLYPDEPGLTEDTLKRIWQNVRQTAFDLPRIRRPKAERHYRRNSTRTLMIAILITLLLAGVAIAATLGIFARFIDHPLNEMSRSRLEHLAEAGQALNQVIEVEIPQHADQAGMTDYERIVARQSSRKIELTMDQVYCDGNNLYYSYQLSEPGRMMTLGTGKPTGVKVWEDAYPGMTIRDVNWMVGEGEEEAEEIAAWLMEGGARYAIYDHVGMGDGASLDDGTEKGQYLAIYDSNSEYIDAFTQQGFQQVELPENYVPEGTIDVLMPVSISTGIIYQDETGLYTTVVRNPENRGYHHVPVTAKVTGKPEEFVVEADFDEYSAEVHLAISDVDISGDVYINAPQAWLREFERNDVDQEPYVFEYALIADGVECRSVDGGWGIDKQSGRWHVMIRYDLPESTESLVLIPKRRGVGMIDSEKIVIR